MEGINNKEDKPVVENLETNVTPNQEPDTSVVSHETMGEDVLAKANEVLAKAGQNDAVLSEETQKKKGIFGRALDFLSGNAPLSPKEDMAVDNELLNHKNWNVKEAYQQAIDKGIGDKYRKAYKRKGLPLYLNKEGTDYTGQSFVAQ